VAGDALVRARVLLDLFNQEGIDVFAERHWDPDIVWTEPPGFPDAGVHRGRDAAVLRMRERFEFLGQVTLDVVDAWEFEDRMMLEVVVHSRGPASGAPTEQREFFLVEFSRERITTFREFLDSDEAFAAFGG
jgi:ketosteroid isomerase-like protein